MTPKFVGPESLQPGGGTEKRPMTRPPKRVAAEECPACAQGQGMCACPPGERVVRPGPTYVKGALLNAPIVGAPNPHAESRMQFQMLPTLAGGGLGGGLGGLLGPGFQEALGGLPGITGFMRQPPSPTLTPIPAETVTTRVTPNGPMLVTFRPTTCRETLAQEADFKAKLKELKGKELLEAAKKVGEKATKFKDKALQQKSRTGVDFFTVSQARIHEEVLKDTTKGRAQDYDQVLRVSTLMTSIYMDSLEQFTDQGTDAVCSEHWQKAFELISKRRDLTVAQVALSMATVHISFDLKRALQNFGVGTDKDWLLGQGIVNQASLDTAKDVFGLGSTLIDPADVFRVKNLRDQVRNSLK